MHNIKILWLDSANNTGDWPIEEWIFRCKHEIDDIPFSALLINNKMELKCLFFNHPNRNEIIKLWYELFPSFQSLTDNKWQITNIEEITYFRLLYA